MHQLSPLNTCQVKIPLGGRGGGGGGGLRLRFCQGRPNTDHNIDLQFYASQKAIAENEHFPCRMRLEQQVHYLVIYIRTSTFQHNSLARVS